MLTENTQSHERKVQAIRNGTVIDHIPAGRALVLIRALQLLREPVVTSIGLHFRSQTLGTKDLLKIEERELSENDLAQLSLIAPKCTVNIIKEYLVVKKFIPEAPSEIRGFASCPNPGCITKTEVSNAYFEVINQEDTPIKLRCHYCEKGFYLDDL